MHPVERDRRAYQLALEFMRSLHVSGLTNEVLESYLRCDPPNQSQQSDIPDLYSRLLFHAQYANMKSGVIGNSIGGVEKLRPILFGFDPLAVLNRFGSCETILDRIETELKPRGKLRRTARSIWPSYCRTILSSANFITQFSSAENFHTWIRFFDRDARSRPALPLLIEREIYGYGFPLACDFLKELGYEDFCKPDTHIKDIVQRLELTSSRKDFDVFRAVARVAASAHVTPYRVDRLFWLIGSGNLYKNHEIGKVGRIGNHKAAFFEFALPRMSSATK